MNTKFLGSMYNYVFVNSSFGIKLSISLNMPISIYSTAASGIVLKYVTDKNIINKLCVYVCKPGNLDDNRYSLQFSISSHQNFFLIGEIQYIQNDGDQERAEFSQRLRSVFGVVCNFDATKHISNSFCNMGHYYLGR